MKTIKRIVIFIIIIGIVICGYITYNGYKLYSSVISKMSIEEKVEEIRSKKNYTTIDKIPKDFCNAVIAIEDNRFRKHGAIDIRSIGRAVVTNIKNMKLIEGGSTITQQLAKNMYFSQSKKFTRKIAEILIADDLEKNYDKDEILELYLNIIYFGDGYTGIYNASMGYYNKAPNELNLDEITMLAGLPNAPSVYALSNNPKFAKERQEEVIKAMYLYNYISTDDMVKLNSN